MLFDLFGDFAQAGGRGGEIKLSAIVRLAAELGLRETAVRSAALRLVQDDWLVARREGRHTSYGLTERGRELIEQGRRRIFSGQVGRPWDGKWCVVALTVPEARRELRDRLRKQLSWLGFGSPGSGLYISPRDHAAEVVRLAQRLEASSFLTVYRGEALWPAEARVLVERAWGDLGELAAGYAAFVARFGPRLAEDRRRSRLDSLPGPAAFRTRFTLVSQFRRCMFGDPDLPIELLPVRWPGAEARALFLEYHELVSPAALRHYDGIANA